MKTFINTDVNILSLNKMTLRQTEKIKELQKQLRDLNLINIKGKKSYRYIKEIKCSICGNKNLLQTHHLKPKMFGGNDSPKNLITLCKGCHFFMHCNPILIMREKLRHKKRTKQGQINSLKYNLIGKRGIDKKPRKRRSLREF